MSINYLLCIKYSFMQMSNVSTLCVQTEKSLIQVEFPMHAQSENTKSITIRRKVRKKMHSSKYCHFVKKLFLHANVQVVYIVQRIRCQQQKLCYKLNSPSMHYLRTQNPYEEEKVIKWLSSKGCHFVKKIIFLVSNIFMQMYNVSPLGI